MWTENLLLFLGCILHTQSVLGIWSCTQDADCASLAGSICSNGGCVCPFGQQSVLGGTVCVDSAPYLTSTCFEDHQCSRLLTSFQCRRSGDLQEGNCFCQPGHHYFLGRCWRIVDYGASCTRDEECLSVIRDPYSLACNGTCGCAQGYYSRQRGECRRIGYAVGDGCVLDEDCQFAGGACDIGTFRCYDINAGPTNTTQTLQTAPVRSATSTRQHGVACNATSGCPAPFECSMFGSCICPLGYYASDDGGACLAELGSPSTPEQCVGLFAEVRDGVCTCQPNFFFEENMRGCVKATRRITDSCIVDANCHTFGAASRCGAPQQPWFIRTCECIPEQAVWDAGRQICRLFAGIGESCDVDSDCLAGELEIQCVRDSQGQGFCTCPEGFVAVDGLCLTTGLGLGDACQASQECTAAAHAECSAGRCSCAAGYQQAGDACAPIIGGSCAADSDCVIANTGCYSWSGSGERTCRCRAGFVEYDDVCWTNVLGIDAVCNVTAQCVEALGDAGFCSNGSCACAASYHFRDGGCWPITGLFETCSRQSQCYLGDITERVVCRNSLCQCDFNYPYSEELHTCTSSATNVVGSILVVTIALLNFY